MGRWGLILACVAVLYGCAVPLPVRVASWAIDGISYLATKKTVADHGISFVAKKDCSVLRGVTRKEFCIDGAPGDTAVAAADDGGEAETETPDGVEVAATSPSDVDDLNEFETAAGPASESGAPQLQVLAAPETELTEPGSGTSASPVSPTAAVTVDDATLAKLSAAVPPRRPRWQPPAARTSVGAGFYYVVGSFRHLENAQSLAGRHGALALTIVEARLDGQTHFRVVAGPFERTRGKDLRRQLRRAGISDAWAIALNPVDWSVARSRTSTPSEVASAVAEQ